MNKRQKIENNKADDNTQENIIIAHDVIEIPDGRIDGILTDIQRRRSELYDYVDLYFEIEIDGEKTNIKTGYPANISAKSGLGSFIEMCGFDIVPDKEYKLTTLKQALYGKIFSFNVIHESTVKGKFARIVNSSIEYHPKGEN